MDDARNVLVVGVGQALFDKIAPVLKRRSFEVDRFPDGHNALELLARVPFNAIVVGYPIPGLPLEPFLTAVQQGRSAGAAVALLTDEEHRTDAERFRGHGVDLVLAAERATKEANRLLCVLLGVSPRAAMRVLVRLELHLEPRGISDRFMAQTEDLSASGMLVTTKRKYPVGSTARFELAIADGRGPIAGEAQVARQTEPPADRVEGIGFRFLSFEGEGGERLQLALARLGGGLSPT